MKTNQLKIEKFCEWMQSFNSTNKISDADLIDELRVITNWDRKKIQIKMSRLKCDHNDAKNFFIVTGRMPSLKEQTILNNVGFDAWNFLFQRGHIK